MIFLAYMKYGRQKSHKNSIANITDQLEIKVDPLVMTKELEFFNAWIVNRWPHSSTNFQSIFIACWSLRKRGQKSISNKPKRAHLSTARIWVNHRGITNILSSFFWKFLSDMPNDFVSGNFWCFQKLSIFVFLTVRACLSWTCRENFHNASKHADKLVKQHGEFWDFASKFQAACNIQNLQELACNMCRGSY